MQPEAVRPDRDAAGRTHAIRQRRCRASLADVELLDVDAVHNDEWTRKLPVDMRTLLMQIMNIDLMVCIFFNFCVFHSFWVCLKVCSGDTHADPLSIYPLQISSLRGILEDPTLLDGKRTEVCMFD